MSSNSNDYSHLKELGKSNYEIADGESDIRNWVVKNENGNILGEVDELIFDTTARKAVFIVLNLDKNELNLKERRVLLPLEHADVHEAYKNVVYKGLMPNQIAVLPSYEKGKFTRNSIDSTRSTFLTSMSNDNSQQAHTEHRSQGNIDSDRRQDTYQSTEQIKSERQDLRENRREDIKDREQDSITHREPANPEPQKPREVFSERRQENDFAQQERTPKFPESDSKPFTVVGVFESSRQTQGAIEYLLNNGFTKSDITVSTRQTDVSHDQNNRDESGITHFFKSLFNNDDDVKRYSDATERGSVVSIDVSSEKQAEETANILDQHGCVNLKSNQQDSSDSKTGNARIFKRRTNS